MLLTISSHELFATAQCKDMARNLISFQKNTTQEAEKPPQATTCIHRQSQMANLQSLVQAHYLRYQDYQNTHHVKKKIKLFFRDPRLELIITRVRQPYYHKTPTTLNSNTMMLPTQATLTILPMILFRVQARFLKASKVQHGFRVEPHDPHLLQRPIQRQSYQPC